MIEVVAGCMYSGKSEELISRLRRHEIANRQVMAFKPSIDDRYSEDEISTHPGSHVSGYPCIPVDNAYAIRDLLSSREYCGVNVIGIEEAQFFGDEIIPIAEQLANQGKTVIMAGLDLDSEGMPFGPMAELMAVADKVMKKTAICVATNPRTGETCGKDATRSYKVPDQSNGNRVEVGSHGLYEARCRECWNHGRSTR